MSSSLDTRRRSKFRLQSPMASTTGECDLDLSSCFIIRRKILSSNNRYFACRLRCYARHYKLQITENSLSESFDLAELECSGLHFVRFPFLQSAPKVICRTTSAISAKRTHTQTQHYQIQFLLGLHRFSLVPECCRNDIAIHSA